MKIVHITSAHPVLDVRIFYKECLSLLNAGHEVHLIAPQSVTTEVQGIKIHALNLDGKTSRWQRLIKIYQLAKSIPADIYHFHDPEFIPFAFLLKIQGKKIIYDVHEDTPLESLSFNKGRLLRAYFKYCRWYLLESVAKLLFDGFVCATPHIAKNFPARRICTVRNYVNVEEFSPNDALLSFEDRKNVALYVGGIMKIRGFNEMVKAINSLPDHYDHQLKLIGKFSPEHLQNELSSLDQQKKVISLNWLDRKELLPHFFSAKVGLVLLHPEKNFVESLPIKLFEYMAAGLPVIVSDFPLWREIISKARCGFLVNPLDIADIKKALMTIFDHPKMAYEMGLSGQQAVRERYNFNSEAGELIKFYQRYSSVRV